jgi:hypothetical protein
VYQDTECLIECRKAECEALLAERDRGTKKR